MTTLELRINLPDQVAREAQAAGLLKPQALEQLLREALRRKAVDELFNAADRLADAQFPAMTMEEVQAEVNAVRAKRQRSATGA